MRRFEPSQAAAVGLVGVSDAFAQQAKTQADPLTEIIVTAPAQHDRAGHPRSASQYGFETIASRQSGKTILDWDA